MRHAGVDAHSGYITVRNKSHLFFLLLKAPESVFEKAPLILWLQGGPGRSGLFGQFLENGPLGLDATGRLYNRSCAFQRDASVLYVDYPAGGGFSIIEDPSVLSRSLKDVTDDLQNFLTQFYMLFKEFESRDVYFAGESYGARAAVALANRTQESGKKCPSGLVLSAGFLTPLEESILKSPNFLYQLGLLDDKGRQKLANHYPGSLDERNNWKKG
ncbi:vitellogenic carboxypeptidase-like [Amblyomma americanum]